jgi:hypothetical protein
MTPLLLRVPRRYLPAPSQAGGLPGDGPRALCGTHRLVSTGTKDSNPSGCLQLSKMSNPSPNGGIMSITEHCRG